VAAATLLLLLKLSVGQLRAAVLLATLLLPLATAANCSQPLDNCSPATRYAPHRKSAYARMYSGVVAYSALLLRHATAANPFRHRYHQLRTAQEVCIRQDVLWGCGILCHLQALI
jgi:hypothetical protein